MEFLAKWQLSVTPIPTLVQRPGHIVSSKANSRRGPYELGGATLE